MWDTLPAKVLRDTQWVTEKVLYECDISHEDWDPHVSRSPPSLGSWDNVSSSFPPPEQIATLPRPLLKRFATLIVPREAAEKQKAQKQRMQRTNGLGRLQGMKQASASERLLLWPLPQSLCLLPLLLTLLLLCRSRCCRWRGLSHQ